MELGVDFAEDVNLEESIRVHVKITNKFHARCVVYGVDSGGFFNQASLFATQALFAFYHVS